MLLDKNHCWTAFKYIKPLQFKTTLALKDTEGYIAVTMKVKETLVRKPTFLKPARSFAEPQVLFLGIVHLKVIKKVVSEALMTQATMKVFGPDKIYFQILQII